ncbi:AHH domain-containing protein [Bacillus cereus group sp. BfR-BA-00331]|uniref:AHH domain-containing protein n=1 Tax=Bacillus cereus group TaxID=86661 RepID=UPI0009B5AC52|nr:MULTISPECIES: AHH domain-containing protein [Bacillus cereus group]MDA2197008.1 AHH domain-containing protein [Bacillus cereus group sp. Bc238]MDA2202716.1 AHH domain-containing protein [Bacillus cereus group sp. Bc237]MDA2666599.1 AHH domain-containing protein [Bacillus cereus group sp. Bc032]MDA2677310.1 AHH domain-containing protein [Bacillus cereus group sp. Bc031]MDA2682797.1 AHH domain-containing protein [Bacillus cereus group sp. Bc029]
MDVKYRPEPWQNMGDGMNRITKDALIKLQRANELLKKIDGRIRDLDSDGSIHFNPKDQSQKIGELLDSYSTLQRYCGEAGRLVSEHIDKPFLVEMDKFAQKMRDTSILSFETDNRIGSTTTTVLPDAHAGYGSVPQTIKTKKDKITVEDIFRDSPAFDNVLREEYKELKKQNPDAKLNYEEYKKVVPSTRGFEYKSIEDEQKKLEMVRDIGIGLGIIITTILCPPLGTAAAVVYGAVQIKSGIDGEDWGTHRKLSQEERVGNIIFGGLDAIPVVGAVGKGVKAFKGTSELADLAKLLKFKEGMPGFNPNLGENVVQSLRDNKAIMLDRLKLASLKMEKSGNEKMYQLGEKIAKSIDDRTAKSASFEVDGNGLLLSKQGGTDFQSWVNKHHTESNKIIDDKIKGVEASLASKGTGEGSRIIPGTPGIVTGGNSTKLGKNMMTEMGLRRSTKWSGYQAQHIIPSEMADNPVIKKIGMNFDDSSNGIFLRVPDDNISTMARHRGYHSVYNEVVARALNKMDINQSIDSLQKQVYDLQKNLRKLQGNGLPLYPSQGATVELWERKLKQLEIQNK